VRCARAPAAGRSVPRRRPLRAAHAPPPRPPTGSLTAPPRARAPRRRSIGVLLDLLMQTGDFDDTLIYFASDNGPFREELDESGSCGFAPVLPADTPALSPAAAPALRRAATTLKGAKGQTWECGVRVPAIISWPARWAGGRAAHLATSAIDILPTVLSAASVAPRGVRRVAELRAGERAGPRVLDGTDLLPLLDGPVGGPPPADADAVVHFMYCGARVAAARQGRFKAHFTTAKWQDERAQICKENVICGCHGHVHDPPLLFDLHADPAELTPLDPAVPAHAAALGRISEAKMRHEATVEPYPSQTELLPSPAMLPCCNAEKGTAMFYWKVLTNTCGC
jgi:arylsulfatase A